MFVWCCSCLFCFFFVFHLSILFFSSYPTGSSAKGRLSWFPRRMVMRSWENKNEMFLDCFWESFLFGRKNSRVLILFVEFFDPICIWKKRLLWSFPSYAYTVHCPFTITCHNSYIHHYPSITMVWGGPETIVFLLSFWWARLAPRMAKSGPGHARSTAPLGRVPYNFTYDT